MRAKLTRLLSVVMLLLLGAASSGCIYSREISNTRSIIEEEIPGSEFDRQLVFSIGTRTLRAAEWITTLVPDEDSDRIAQYLDDVERIRVGIYDTRKLPDDDSFGVPQLSGLADRGWEVVVRTRDEQDRIWLMYRAHRGRIRALYVIVLNDEQLIIARLEGHLDRLVRRAMVDYRPFTRLAHR